MQGRQSRGRRLTPHMGQNEPSVPTGLVWWVDEQVCHGGQERSCWGAGEGKGAAGKQA